MSLKASTVVYASIGTVVTGCMAYAAYFDWKRRNDPEFRRQLKRESKRQARAAKVEARENSARERQQLREMVDAAKEEGFPPQTEEDYEQFMAENLGRAEVLTNSQSTWKEAAVCYWKALKIYPQKKELMGIYDKSLPKPLLDMIAQMVAYDQVTESAYSSSSGAGVE